MNNLSWQNLQNYAKMCKQGKTPPEIPRTSKDQRKYMLYRNLFKNRQTFIQHLLSTYLDKGAQGALRWNIQPNKFPYILPNNVEHYVMWLSPLNTPSPIEVDQIVKEYFKGYETIHYMNPVPLQSIQEIPHYQIFVKMS